MYKARTTVFLIMLMNLALWLGCTKDEQINSHLSYHYFPIDIGHWVIYDCDSIYYNEFTGNAEHYSYQVKELIESSFLDNQGRTTYRLERSKRDSASGTWNLMDVWYCNRDAYRAEKVEENERYIKLIFPMHQGEEWDGNAYNTQTTLNYEYTQVNQNDTINGMVFDSVVTITQENSFIPIIHNKQKVEKYAVNIGMIYKRYFDVEFQCQTGDTCGIDYTMMVNSYGN